MNSMKIGTYQMDTTFGLYLPEYTIPAPAVQTNFVKIIGRDGSVDLSNALGLHYDSRTWSLDFKCFDPTVNWHTLSSQVMNAIHGKRLNFEFDDDPDYFWTGRVSVQNYVSNHGTGTLKVTIVSDPFKYAKLSTIVTKTASTGTDYTGALVTFNTANAKINDLSVTMQPIQDLHGYSSPWPAGGGKNKFEVVPFSVGEMNGITFTYNSDGSVTVNGTATARAYKYLRTYSAGWFPVGTTYTFRLAGVPSTASAAFLNFSYSDNGTTYAGSYGPLTYEGTKTITSAHQYNSVLLDIPAGQSFNNNKIYVNAEVGTTASAWTPYSNICPISGRTGLSVYVSPTQDQQDATTYASDWTSEAGTVYGGTLDVVTGVLTVDKVIAEFDGSSDETWYWHNSGVAYGLVSGGFITNATTQHDALTLCDKLQPSSWASRSTKDNSCGMFYGASYVFIRNTNSITNVATARTWLAANPITVMYPLATPLTYQLTAQEVEALVGTNNVWSDGGNVTVAVVTPETLTNNGRAVVPTLTASADMVLKWGNYSASVQQGTSTIPQLILENGANLIYIIGTGSISFTWQEASL